MKMHYGFYCEYGDYESLCGGYEETICGCDGEKVLEEYTTDCWDKVTCKKCLRLKDAVIKAEEEDEKEIVRQMSEMLEALEERSSVIYELVGCHQSQIEHCCCMECVDKRVKKSLDAYKTMKDEV